MKKASVAYEQKRRNEEKLNQAWREMNEAIGGKQWDQAEAKIAETEKLLPEDERDNLDTLRLRVLLGKEDYDGAYKLARRITDANRSQAGIQNQLAGKSPPIRRASCSE